MLRIAHGARCQRSPVLRGASVSASVSAGDSASVGDPRVAV